MNWYSADFHFNHSNIISKFVFRPFRNVAHMNSELIKRYNDRVKPGDTCYIIGDFKLSSEGQNTHDLLSAIQSV